ncbi:MAG: glutamate 5-kinase [Acidiferrobacteraceae bacterium]|jgi:glutamate 5-kinase|nr:glutamate 5-kinase [Acidiferrobacteraceae bacterium]MDP7568270.1 glutamate 5-kinase [Arenicellales bacterium]|tara:strand:- start:5638 stop:6765 length:1128 start_codon:yes stop_codon:yes gene_type:complete
MSDNTGRGSDRQRWVIKLGSSLLTDPEAGLNHSLIEQLATVGADLRDRGIDIVLVSSGAIAEGMQRLGWKSRPHELFRLQAAAAVGQMGLAQAYQNAFSHFSVQTAQILLTEADLNDRTRYLNARSALRSMLELGIVPVVNENDTVVTEEIQFGDNDTLGALVTNLVEAEYLVILTDQQGLFDADPRHQSNAHLIREAMAGDAALEAYAGPGGALGRGGMLTKLQAAARAARSGASTVICSGHDMERLADIANGNFPGTVLRAGAGRIAARKQWLAGRLRASGRLFLDAGAVAVLIDSGKSLLPVGVQRLEGRFERGDLVDCVDAASGRAVARGLINYGSVEAEKIIGLASSQIEEILGYVDEPELVHRDNMVVF